MVADVRLGSFLALLKKVNKVVLYRRHRNYDPDYNVKTPYEYVWSVCQGKLLNLGTDNLAFTHNILSSTKLCLPQQGRGSK